jgi:hypothetical protein
MNDFTEHLRYISPELGELCDWAADEREMILEDALNACLNAGVDREHLKTLARETGATHWALKHSLKEKA